MLCLTLKFTLNFLEITSRSSQLSSVHRTARQNCCRMRHLPFEADSENSTPLLATIPTGWPYSLPQPVTRVLPYCFLNSSNLEPSRSRARTALTSQGFLGSAGTTPADTSALLSCEQSAKAGSPRLSQDSGHEIALGQQAFFKTDVQYCQHHLTKLT